MAIKIVTDSTCDLPKSIAEEYGITVIPVYINMQDKSYLDGEELTREEFYARLPECRVPPTTSAPGLGTFIDVYRTLGSAKGDEILSIHISANLSNIVNVAHLASEAVRETSVKVFDGGQLTLGTGLLAIEAAKAAASGMKMQEILKLLGDKSARTHTMAVLDTLEFLRRSGRVSNLQYGLGALLDIKPLLTMNLGQMAMERVRTTKRGVQQLVDKLNSRTPIEQFALVHTHAYEAAQALGRKVQHLLPHDVSMFSAEVTPAIGTHIGPGAVGFSIISAIA